MRQRRELRRLGRHIQRRRRRLRDRFGGKTLFIVTWLIEAPGEPAAPACDVAGTSVITALAMMALPESRDRVLED